MYRLLFLFSIMSRETEDEEEYGFIVHYLFDQKTGEPLEGQFKE